MRFDMQWQQDNMRDWIRIFGKQAMASRSTPEERAKALVDMREMQDDLAELVETYGWNGNEDNPITKKLWPCYLTDLYHRTKSQST